ncbi:MAG TPA: SRPBCC family protein, partial [Acidimicrobiia bacterium]
MTVRIRVCTTIDAPPARVWEVVENIEHHTEWMTDAERITFVSSTTSGVGTEFDCLTRVGPFRMTDRMTVTEWES